MTTEISLIDLKKLMNLTLCPILSQSLKLFHAYVRNKKVGRPSAGPLKYDSGSVCSSNQEMSDLFVKTFSSVFPPRVPGNPAEHQLFDGSLHVWFSYYPLRDLNPSSSIGPDGVHPCLLKHCSTSLAYPLISLSHK